MISVVFPGQGSQTVGMASSLYENYGYIKDFFALADETLKYPISKLILKGPVEELNKTENTQPAIFIVSYSIFETIKKEKNIDLSKIKFLAGHSLGEYSALACSGSLEYEQTIKLLKIRGKAMQTAVPDGRGGMVAVLGSNIETVKEILFDNKKNFECYIANDNSDGQIVLSGLNGDLVSLIEELKKKRNKKY